MLFTDSDRLHENYIQLMVYIFCGLLENAIEPVIMYMNLHMENKFLPITISSISRVVSNSFFVAVLGMDLWGFTLSRIVGTTVYISYIFSLGVFKYKLKSRLKGIISSSPSFVTSKSVINSSFL